MVEIRKCEKLPKLNWKDGMTATDKGYICPTITVIGYNGDLYVRLRKYDRTAFYCVIEGYKNYTAMQVLSATTFGRHYETLILKYWKANGLKIGLAEGVLRNV